MKNPAEPSSRIARPAQRAEPIATIVTALVVALLGILNVANPGILASATLAVLALVTHNLTQDHNRTRRIEHLLRHPRASSETSVPPALERILTLAPPGPSLSFANAQEIRLVGDTQNRPRSEIPSMSSRSAPRWRTTGAGAAPASPWASATPAASSRTRPARAPGG